eukprot:CAMPEP_0196725978 /NCGR_PEP_ID=MMETSP1091-20130531/7375_1 /TAXON_ID=302021 /ORGANISM="Rhodomonas sp., Strain CCMP768" /LENGTH=226 /DNA_ID=CAMNT_0042068331 /DNA_START=63 /DNA_END=740 /DNA_ORIENTATION=+
MGPEEQKAYLQMIQKTAEKDAQVSLLNSQRGVRTQWLVGSDEPPPNAEIVDWDVMVEEAGPTVMLPISSTAPAAVQPTVPATMTQQEQQGYVEFLHKVQAKDANAAALRQQEEARQREAASAAMQRQEAERQRRDAEEQERLRQKQAADLAELERRQEEARAALARGQAEAAAALAARQQQEQAALLGAQTQAPPLQMQQQPLQMQQTPYSPPQQLTPQALLASPA